MKEQRISMLEKYIQDDPHDPFPLYALALEYVEREVEKSVELFDKTLQKFPVYLPTYYHAAALFADLGEIEKAKSLYEKGIQLAQDQKEQKTLNELRAAFQNFRFENGLD
jgi:tetratricopeptide (TPR) repeat protein